MKVALLLMQIFMTSFSNKEYEGEHLQKLLTIKAFLLIGTMVMLIFGIINFLKGIISNGLFGLITAIIFLMVLLLLRFNKMKELYSNLFLTLIALISISAYIFNDSEKSILFWFYIFPLISIFLDGIRRGLIYSFIFLGYIIFLLLFSGVGLSKLPVGFIISFLGGYVAVTIFSLITENFRKKTFQNLENFKANMEDHVKERVAELELAKTFAEESDKLKSEFISNLSNEIRTPMNAIVGFSNLLQSRGIDENLKREMIKHIAANSSTLLNLVDDIVDITKIDSNKLEVNYHEVNVRNVLANIYNDFEERKVLLDKRHIELIYNLQDFPEVSICSDDMRITQIFRYLLENAFKYTEKGAISIGYTIENELVLRFYVKDTGIGIPKSMGNKIFDRFVSGEKYKHKFHKGTGLGLSLCKSLVEILGGTIEYTSQPNKGTIFYFTVLSQPDKVQEGIKSHPIELNWENKTVLIAEDDESNYKYLKYLLNKTHATVLWAQNGQEAVEMASKNDIDLILMDIKMPVMNGLDATREIKGLKKNIPIIAQTAFVYENDEKVSLSSGCDAYIAKPIGKSHLLDLMQRYMK